jgi:hypothetical protein
VTPYNTAAPSPIIAALSKVKKSQWLTTAEATMRATRADRAAASDRLRELIAEKGASSGDHTGSSFDRRIAEADLAIKAFDPMIASARDDLAAARLAWHPAAARKLAEPIAEAVAEANDLLRRVAEIADGLRAAGRFAADNNLLDVAPHSVRHAPSLIAAIADARLSLQRDA